MTKRRNYPGSSVRGLAGAGTSFEINDAISNEGVIDMASRSLDYTCSKNQDDDFSFKICIETAGVVKGQLIGQEEGEVFTITAAQVNAYLGQWYPAKFAKIYKTGTTATFSVGF